MHTAYAAYAVQQPSVAGARHWRQHEPADVSTDLGRLTSGGVTVYALREVPAERGLSALPLNKSVHLLGHEQLPDLYESVNQVWQ